MNVHLRVGLLGPLRATIGTAEVDVGTAKQRCVLAVLALEAGRVVPVDSLVDRVWGDDPPAQARNLLQTYVARLRKALTLAGADGAGLLRFSHGGYRLDLEPDRVDAHHVRRLLARTPDGPAAQVELLRDVLDTFTGEPLAGIDGDWASRTRQALDQQRMSARRRLAEARLELGGHEEVVTELDELAEENPLDEGIAALRMLALYRSGRQAEALAAFRRIRQRLVEELGDDPGPELRELHDRILRRDADLSASRPETEPPAPPSWTSRDDLPRAPTVLIGRTGEIERLRAAADWRPDEVTVVAVDGAPGVGKTALALTAARHLAERCPDARLYLDLRGHCPEGAPVSAHDALAMLLRAVGVPEPHIPGTEAERAAAWRARLAGRRVLLVLDDARAATQVRPLLPAAAGCVVIVTSRSRLSALADTVMLSLGPLSNADGLALFSAVVGPADDGDHYSRSQVVELCGGLPLAVELAAARLRHRPNWTVEDLLRRLRDSRRGLRELRAGDLTLISAFEVSYRELPREVRRMFRRLGLHAGPDLDPDAAAALLGSDCLTAEDRLEQLLDHHLVEQPAEGRYRLLTVLRDYATQLAAEDGPGEAADALRRLLAHYLGLVGSGGPSPERLDQELDNLVASTEAAGRLGVDEDGWKLALALYDHLENRRRYHTGARWYELALAAAKRRADLAGEIAMSRCAGVMRWRCGELSRAEELLTGSLRHAGRVGDAVAEAEAAYHLGGLALQSRRPEAATAHYAVAVRRFGELGLSARRADGLNNVGVCHTALGAYDEAERCLLEALELRRTAVDRRGQAATLTNLANLRLARGDQQGAMATLLPVLELTRGSGDVREEVAARTNIAIIALHSGDYAAADTHLEQALRLARALDDPYEEIGTLIDVAVARLDAGQVDRIEGSLRAALALAERIAARDEQARALTVLGQVAARDGRRDEARAYWSRSLAILDELGPVHALPVRALVDDLDADLPAPRRPGPRRRSR